MEVIRVANPVTLCLPDVQGLFHRALTRTFFADGDTHAALTEFIKMVGHPEAGIFLGWENSLPKGLFIISPPFPLFPVPQVWHAYNEGSKRLAVLMARKGIEFLLDKGYNTVHAVNGTGIPVDTWLRVFRLNGTCSPIGTMHRIDLNELRNKFQPKFVSSD